MGDLLPFVLSVHMLFDEKARRAEMLSSKATPGPVACLVRYVPTPAGARL